MNKRGKVAIKVQREGKHFLIQPFQEEELLDGDVLWPIGVTSIRSVASILGDSRYAANRT